MGYVAKEQKVSRLGVAGDRRRVFISVAKRSQPHVIPLARQLEKLGCDLLATKGTAQRLEEAGIKVIRVKKLQEGHPNLLDYILNGELQLVMNTPSGKGARTDEGRIRAATVQHGIPCITTLQAAEAAVRAMTAMREEELTVQAIQDRFPDYARKHVAQPTANAK